MQLLSRIPLQKGRGELVTMASCLLHHANFPATFWAEAVATACYINNRAPTKILGSLSPEEVWTGKTQSLSNIRVFGCRAFSLDQRTSRRKVDSKSIPCIYLGPSIDSPRHRLYNIATKRVIISRNVLFDEQTLGFPQSLTSTSNNDIVHFNISLSPPSSSLPTTLHHSHSLPGAPSIQHDLTSLDFEEIPSSSSSDEAVTSNRLQDIDSTVQTIQHDSDNSDPLKIPASSAEDSVHPSVRSASTQEDPSSLLAPTGTVAPSFRVSSSPQQHFLSPETGNQRSSNQPLNSVRTASTPNITSSSAASKTKKRQPKPTY